MSSTPSRSNIVISTATSKAWRTGGRTLTVSDKAIVYIEKIQRVCTHIKVQTRFFIHNREE